MSESKRRVFGASVLLAVVSLFGVAQTASAFSVPAFTKVFSPDTIGPGSTSQLTFTIDNNENVPVGELAFDDPFPFEIDLAAPSFVSNTCGGTLTLDDEDDSSEYDVRLEDGKVGAGQECTIVVNVTSTILGTHENFSGALQTQYGSGSSADADLTVDDILPSFTKSFDDATVSFGGRSTLTFLIDNTTDCGECAADIESLFFTDNLPAGMLVANPANASTDCENPLIPATLVADPGSSVISLSAFGSLPSFPVLADEESCTVIVDVIGGAVGELGNVTGNLLATANFDGMPGNETVDVGRAAAVLEVEGFTGLLQLTKDFSDDPVAPGGIFNLGFTVTNKSRGDSATGIAFDDDLETTLTGLAPAETLPKATCGGTLDFAAGTLSFSGGSLASAASCTINVELLVPAAAPRGVYSNTSGMVTGTVGGEPETGNSAFDTLFVETFPLLTKTFTDDPVGAGGTVTLEFTITNTAADSTLADIAFIDELTDNSGGLGGPSVGNGFLPFPVTVALPPSPNPPCGPGSSLVLVNFNTDRERLELTGGSLAAAGGAGDSCTFSMSVDIPEGFPGGIYTNTTGSISAKLADVGSQSVTGPPASDAIVVVGAPQLAKEFTDDPVAPGGTVTLEFTLENPDPDNDASMIAFSDNLGDTLAGLVISGVLENGCGGMNISGDASIFDYTGGFLAAEASCTIALELSVPSGVGGVFGNETSEVTATVAGLSVTGPPANDDLIVTGLQFSKEFLDNPAIPGGTTTLRFTINNIGTSVAEDATDMSFFDSLGPILPGTPDVTSSGPPTVNTCGGTESGTPTFLIYSGGSLGFGSTCTIEYELNIPAATAEGGYTNVSSELSATVDGNAVTSPPAVDVLSITDVLLAMTKEFTDDPVAPGDAVTLEFTITNLSETETVTDITFSDNLDDVIDGLEATSAFSNGCGGMAAGFPATNFEYLGGTLGPAASCTIALEVTVPGPLPAESTPPYINTTTTLTGDVGVLPVYGDPASDELFVQTAKLSKSFDGPTAAGDTAVLTFEIDNLSNSPLGSLSFFDNLDDVLPGLEAIGLPQPVCGGTISGTSFVTFSGGSLAANTGCEIDVTVEVPEAFGSCGQFVNTTSPLTQSGLVLANPATALLEITGVGDGAFLQEDGLASIEAEHFVTNDPGTTVGPFNVLGMLDDMIVSNGEAIQAVAGPATTNAATAPRVTYEVQLEAGTQNVWLRYRAFSSSTNSFKFQYDDGPIQTVTLSTANPTTWKWVKVPTPPTVFTPSEVHTLTIYRRERLAELDKIVVSNEPGYTPMGLGPAESTQAGGCSGNLPPVLDPIGDQTVIEGTPETIMITSADIDGNDLEIEAMIAPPLPFGTVTLTDNLDGTAELSISAEPGDAGDYDITVTVTDNGSPPLSDSETFTVSVVEPGGTGPFLQIGGIATMEAENFFTNNPGMSIGPFNLLGPLDDMIVSNGDAIAAATGPATTTPSLAPSVTYDVELEAGPQYVWIRYRAFSSATNSFFFQLDDSFIQTVTLSASSPGDWKWVRVPSAVPIVTGGEVHTVTFYRRERLAEIDKIVVTNDSGYTPMGLGPDESPRGPGL